MAENKEYLLARWESASGKHWVELWYNPEFRYLDGTIGIDVHYNAPQAGGSIAATSPSDAVQKMQERLDRGGFQPDANKKPMKRVYCDVAKSAALVHSRYSITLQ